MSYELLVGARHLKSKQRSFISTITLISMLGVVVGVATLTTVVSVTGGFQEAFREKVLGINSHILVMKYGINYREYRDTIRTVEAIDGVEAASPFIFHEMMLSHDERLSGVLIKGIDPDRAERISDLPRYVKAGDLKALRWHLPDPLDDALKPRPDDAAPANGGATPDTTPPGDAAPSNDDDPSAAMPGILLGTELAEKLRVGLGDSVMVVSPLRGFGGEWGPTQMAPTSKRFRVAGLYRSGFHEYDTKLVIVDYRALQDFFSQGDVVTGIEIRVTDVFAVGGIAGEIKSLLPAGRFRTLDWREINRNLFTSLRLQKLVLAIILTFIVIVASFNIVSTLIMIVLDKSKEIAILKSMGASDQGILIIFVFQGMVIGCLGTLLGLLGGLGCCVIIANTSLGMDPQVYLIDTLPVKMEALEFALIAAVALTISFLATLYPAWRAARLPPVEGLKYD